MAGLRSGDPGRGGRCARRRSRRPFRRGAARRPAKRYRCDRRASASRRRAQKYAARKVRRPFAPGRRLVRSGRKRGQPAGGSARAWPPNPHRSCGDRRSSRVRGARHREIVREIRRGGWWRSSTGEIDARFRKRLRIGKTGGLGGGIDEVEVVALPDEQLLAILRDLVIPDIGHHQFGTVTFVGNLQALESALGLRSIVAFEPAEALFGGLQVGVVAGRGRDFGETRSQTVEIDVDNNGLLFRGRLLLLGELLGRFWLARLG